MAGESSGGGVMEVGGEVAYTPMFGGLVVAGWKLTSMLTGRWRIAGGDPIGVSGGVDIEGGVAGGVGIAAAFAIICLHVRVGNDERRVLLVWNCSKNISAYSR